MASILQMDFINFRVGGSALHTMGYGGKPDVQVLTKAGNFSRIDEIPSPYQAPRRVSQSPGSAHVDISIRRAGAVCAALGHALVEACVVDMHEALGSLHPRQSHKTILHSAHQRLVSPASSGDVMAVDGLEPIEASTTRHKLCIAAVAERAARRVEVTARAWALITGCPRRCVVVPGQEPYLACVIKRKTRVCR